MTDFNQPCSDGFSIADGITKSVTLNLQDDKYPGTTLYPSVALYPGNAVGIVDSNVNTYTKNETEVFNIIDSPVKAIVKNIEEGGLYPSTTLYPTGTRYPNSGILVSDEIVNTPCKNLSDSSTISDGISSFGIGKGLSDSVDFLEGFSNEITKYLEENSGVVESLVHNIGKNVGESTTISDVFTVVFSSYLTDSVGISDDTVKSIVKYLSEGELTPYNTLYPSEILYPGGGILVSDDFNFGFTTNLSDGFSIIDSIAHGIIKDIPDNINISDDILFSVGLYLEENPNILDEISKGGYKSLTDQAAFVDDITKSITSSLSDTINIDDEIETVLRTLVRATLEAVDDGGATLSAIKNRISSLGLA